MTEARSPQVPNLREIDLLEQLFEDFAGLERNDRALWDYHLDVRSIRIPADAWLAHFQPQHTEIADFDVAFASQSSLHDVDGLRKGKSLLGGRTEGWRICRLTVFA